MRGATRVRNAALKIARRDIVNRGGRGVVGLIDIGSVGGLPEPWRYKANLVRSLLCFEPLEHAWSNGIVTVVPAALWRCAETRPFYVQVGTSHGDSLYPPGVGHVRAHWDELRQRGPERMAETWFDRSAVARVEQVETTTLDAVLDEVNGRYDFLKIDAQGADFDIILGAQRFLETDCLGVQVEGFTVPLYEGITLLDGIDAHMNGIGFDRVWTAAAHGTFDSQHDVMYLRREAPASPALAAIKRVYGIPAVSG